MSTPIPTSEDMALAEKVTDLIAESLNREHATYAQIAQPIADYCAPLRELAEIGRLAVEYQRDCSSTGAPIFSFESARLSAALDAYLAKHPTNPTT